MSACVCFVPNNAWPRAQDGPFDKVQLRGTCISSSSHMEKERKKNDGGDKVFAAALRLYVGMCVCVCVCKCVCV